VPKRLRLEEIAGVAGLSRTHFSRVFKKEMGVGVSEYVNQIRCERASDLLSRGGMNAAEVAEACGFSDHSYFTRVFKRITGKTPSEVGRGELTR
jgi:AraC-like DNA-binding protein